MRIYYFGCWERLGHYLWLPDGRRATDVQWALPWAFLDTTLCPGRRNRFGDVNPLEQREGWAALHHREGWTALAFWDRSVDKRHGSNSAFIAEGVLDVAEMLEASDKAFPGVMARFTFPIVVERCWSQCASLGPLPDHSIDHIGVSQHDSRKLRA